jgi:hypothetical protein
MPVIKLPQWSISSSVRKFDLDEFNCNVNVLTADLEVVQSPFFHRNTINFEGMAERTFYLAFKKVHDKFIALDKQSHVTVWDSHTGFLISRTKQNYDYSQYTVDRSVYDKNWFSHTLICKTQGGDLAKQSMDKLQFKAIDFSETGEIIDKLTFTHSCSKNDTLHMYLSGDATKIIEIIIPRNKKMSSTYNLYDVMDGQHHFNKELSAPVEDLGLEKGGK